MNDWTIRVICDRTGPRHRPGRFVTEFAHLAESEVFAGHWYENHDVTLAAVVLDTSDAVVTEAPTPSTAREHRNSFTVECERCRENGILFPVDMREETMQTVMDGLRHSGVRSVTLRQLAAIVSGRQPG